MIKPGSLEAKLLELLYYQKAVNFHQIEKVRVRTPSSFEKRILEEVKSLLQSTKGKRLEGALRFLEEYGVIELNSQGVAKLTGLGKVWGGNLCEWEIQKDTRTFIENLVDIIDPSISEMKVLDVGCGGGVSLINITMELSDIACLVGLDISFEALHIGQRLSNWFYESNNSRKVREHSHLSSVIKFINGTALSLPFKDESFDMVISRLTLYLIPREKTLKEIYRVLKKRGKFIVISPSWRYFVMRVFHAHLDFFQSLKFFFPIINGLCMRYFNKQLTLGHHAIYAESRTSLQKALNSERFDVSYCNYTTPYHGTAPLMAICEKR